MRSLKSVEQVRVGLLDLFADQGVIADPFVPFHLRVGRQRRLGEAGHDGDLGEQVLARRLAPADRAEDVAERVLHADGLRAGRLDVLLGPAEAGQQIGDLAVHEMAAVELGRDLHRQAHPRPGLLHLLALGDGAHEVAAEADEGLDLAGQEAFAGLDRVHALLARRLEAELLGELVERHEFSGFSAMPTVRWPCTLEWPRTGEMPVPSRPMLPLSSMQIDEHGDVLEAVHLLGQAHAVEGR